MSTKYKAADDYRYDANGNLTRDQNKNIDNIIYNHLDLPVEIDFHDGDKITYLYNALGQKLKKSAPSGDVMQLGDTETLYLDGFQYVQNSLKFFPHAEGYVNVIDKSGNHIFNYVFNYTDHLGNIRMNWAQDPETGQLKILEENHYYPFGLKHDNYNMNRKDFELENEQELKLKAVPQTQQEVYKYKYNNQEWQDELGLNMTAMDYRQYDNAIGRFNSIDVLSEVFSDNSPYAFAFNNPVFFNDPTGFCPECEQNVKDPKNGQVYKSTGGATYVYNNGQWTQQGGELDEVVITPEKKTSSSSGSSASSESDNSLLFGLIKNPNVNSQGQSPLEVYREKRDNPNYLPGEGKYDRIFRLMNSSHMEQMLDYGGGGHNMFGGYGRLARAASAAEGAYSVYQGLDAAGDVKYVGITSRSPLVRFAEHLASGGEKATLEYRVIKGAQNLTKEQARVLEQTLINQYRLQKNGGNLINQINSIAPQKWGAYGLGQ